MTNQTQNLKHTEIKSLYEDWQKSHETQGTYCKEHEMSPSQFEERLLHARRLGIIPARFPSTQSTQSTQSIQPRSQNFVPINISHSIQAAPSLAPTTQTILETPAILPPYCQISFNGKPGIRIERLENLNQLKTLIDTLIQPSPKAIADKN